MKKLRIVNLRNYLFLFVAFLGGILFNNVISYVFAQTQNGNLIHACVRNNLPNLPNIRIISANQNCNGNETALDWPKEPGNNGFPLMCPNCIFNPSGNDLGNRLQGKNLSNSYLSGTTFYGVSNLEGTNFSNSTLAQTRFQAQLNNANFTGANIDGATFNASLDNTNFQGASGGGTDFTEASGTNSNFQGVSLPDIKAQIATLTQANFTNANLKGADFRNSDFTGSNFSNADLSAGPNSGFANFGNTNLTNVNFTGTNLTGATGMDSATLTGVIWSNTTCPDGTNSDNNGNACVGHLTP